MNVLVVDVGGTHVKILATGQKDRREFSSGPKLTAKKMVAEVKQLAADWQYDAVSIGYPGPGPASAHRGRAAQSRPGWVGFDFAAAFGRPVKSSTMPRCRRSAATSGGRMLFLGLGTGLGTTLIVDGVVEPMELAPSAVQESDVRRLRRRARAERMGRKKWRKYVADVVERMPRRWCPTTWCSAAATQDLKNCRRVAGWATTPNAFIGGFRLWEDAACVTTEKRSHDE